MSGLINERGGDGISAKRISGLRGNLHPALSLVYGEIVQGRPLEDQAQAVGRYAGQGPPGEKIRCGSSLKMVSGLCHPGH